MRTVREAITPSVRMKVLVRDGFRCVYCGATGSDEKIEVDHVIPVAKGGNSHIDNLVTCCFPCNRGKRDKLLLEVCESDIGVYTAGQRSPPEAANQAAVPAEAWDASRKCNDLVAAWNRDLRRFWKSVEALPPAIDVESLGGIFPFAPTFICRGRESCDIGPEVRVLVVGWSEIGRFTPEDQIAIRNAIISGYSVPTMVLMGPPNFFYGVVCNERRKGNPEGFVVDDLLQPIENWCGDGWYPDECLDFQDLRNHFLWQPRHLVRRFWCDNGDALVGVYSSVFRREG